MKLPRHANRRNVLKTIGAGVVGATTLTGAASPEGRNYGNGNGIGAFLNEEAVLKDMPVWDSGVADKTGQSAVNVLVGTLTSVDIPKDLWPFAGEPPEEGPFGFKPRAVEVSPGTQVTWSWVTNHHSVTSFNTSADAPDDHGEVFEGHGDAGNTLSYTFNEVGKYLYFCHPHGTPYPVPFGPLGNVPNHVGMRGAVIVSDE